MSNSQCRDIGSMKSKVRKLLQGNEHYSYRLFWLLFFKLTQTRVTWDEKTSVEKLPPPDWPIALSLAHFLDCWWMWVGPDHSGLFQHLAGSGLYKEGSWVKQGQKDSKQCLFIVMILVSVPAMHFLNKWIIPIKVEQTLFSTSCIWLTFYHSNRK